MRAYICLLLTLASLLSRCAARQRLLYIMLDGFRYDYADDVPPETVPGLRSILDDGVRAEWVTPITPSLSYPDWTTLATGLYAENHNIVGNYFYDAEYDDYFSLLIPYTTGKPKWWTTEPIWTTATKAGLRVALFLWSRCDVPIDFVAPAYCQKYGPATWKDFHRNMNKSVTKFEEGFDFVQVYTGSVDNAGHLFGPESAQRRQAVEAVDQAIFSVRQQLKEKNMDDVNIVVVSDHGMATRTHKIELDDYLPKDANITSITEVGSYMNIKVHPDDLDNVAETLSTMPNVTMYLHDDIPESFHLKGSPYVHDIILQADEGMYIKESRRRGVGMIPPRKSPRAPKGVHGYHHRDEMMRAIFFATGPAFKKNATIDPIEIVDIYQIIAKVIGVEPQPHNGTWSHVEAAFASGSTAGPVVQLVVTVSMLVTMKASF